ncbi:MAG TPA: hypothetical protein ACFCUY_11185 [Xenococcaceae cyanobacterium]|jgi:hypothetical protein
MENTLEVRWFVRGVPPAVVQRWFQFECPGKPLQQELETREDLYIVKKPEDLQQVQAIAPHITHSEEINLKLREGNLELKLRQPQLKTQQFGNVKNLVKWEGIIEQWRKLTESEIGLLTSSVIPQNAWISVIKAREQKLERGVKSELTWLQVNNERWWSVAFEMNQENENNCFQQVLEQACHTYYGPKLVAANSYSYSRWLLELQPPAKSQSQLKV